MTQQVYPHCAHVTPSIKDSLYVYTFFFLQHVHSLWASIENTFYIEHIL